MTITRKLIISKKRILNPNMSHNASRSQYFPRDVLISILQKQLMISSKLLDFNTPQGDFRPALNTFKQPFYPNTFRETFIFHLITNMTRDFTHASNSRLDKKMADAIRSGTSSSDEKMADAIQTILLPQGCSDGQATECATPVSHSQVWDTIP